MKGRRGDRTPASGSPLPVITARHRLVWSEAPTGVRDALLIGLREVDRIDGAGVFLVLTDRGGRWIVEVDADGRVVAGTSQAWRRHSAMPLVTAAGLRVGWPAVFVSPGADAPAVSGDLAAVAGIWEAAWSPAAGRGGV